MARRAEPYRLKITHYVNPDGQRCRKSAKGAKRRVVLTRTYYGLVAGNRVPLGTTDLGAAWIELRRLQRLANDRAAGIIGEDSEKISGDLPPLLDEWCEMLLAKGSGQSHVGTVKSRLLRLFAAAKWKCWGDITKDTLLKGLLIIRQGGKSAQTSNHYRTHAKAFSSWLADRGGSRDPLAKAGGRLNVEADQRHPRRCPADEEIGLLFDYLDRGPLVYVGVRKWTNDDPPVRCRMTARQRAMGYRVAMCTGFRADEVRSLERESFDLEAATVTVEAAYSKHKRTDTQHLPAWIVKMLADYFADGGGLWEQFPAYHPGILLRDDLERAGVPYRTREGFFDFHSPRVWFCTQAANQPGISPKTLMAVCRHSTAQLTLRIYAKVRIADVVAVAEKLPHISMRPSPQKSADRVTVA